MALERGRAGTGRASASTENDGDGGRGALGMPNGRCHGEEKVMFECRVPWDVSARRRGGSHRRARLSFDDCVSPGGLSDPI